MIHCSVRRGLAAAGAVLVLASSAGASAFCRPTTCAAPNAPESCVRDPATGCWATGTPLFWEQACLSYSVVAGGAPSAGFDESAALAIVATGFALWPVAACASGFPSIAAQSTTMISCDRPEYNPGGPNANAVIFRDRDWPHDPSALALTTMSFEPDTGKILDADIEVNTFGQPITVENLEYVVAHEAGHFFGLDHSNQGSALMFARYSPFGESARPVLTSDDQAGICEAYPPLRTRPQCEPEPELGFAPECGGDVQGSCSVGARSAHGAPVPAAIALFFALGLGRWRRVVTRSGGR
jgi:hypothetical protein